MALHSRGRIEFFVSLQIAQLQAGYIFRRKLSHFLLLEIQYFQCFCLQGTYFNYSHFQILLVWDSYPLILLGCFTLKVFLFFLSVDKNQYILLQKETPSNLKYVQLQKLDWCTKNGGVAPWQEVQKFWFSWGLYYQVMLICQGDRSWYHWSKLDKGKDVTYLEKGKTRS